MTIAAGVNMAISDHAVSPTALVWLTAELPIPQPTEVTAEVESA